MVQLAEHVRRGLSGEFICATPALEVHVFLQGGRVAWSTDSAHPLEFSRELMARVNMDVQVFREVIEACRRDRLPLGETLVAWKLASLEDVRAALAHQLRIALEGLAGCQDGSSVFLERATYGQYDERLTFELAEVLGRAEPPAAEVAPAPWETPPHSVARELLVAIKGAQWVELLEEGRSIDAAGEGGHPRVSPAFAAAALGEAADFVALRSEHGALLGARLAGSPRQAWAALGPDAAIGAAVAALFSAGGVARPPRAKRGADLTPWRRGSEASGALLGDAFAFGRDVLALVLLSGDDLVFATGRGLDEGECVGLARRRAGLFAVAPFAGGGAPVDGGRGRRNLVTGEERVWCFGAEAEERGAARTVWVLTRRDGAQGIGWACLTALCRALSGSSPDRSEAG